MNKYGTDSMLDIVINDILKAVTPIQDDWAIRFMIINDVRRVVESMESLRGATVEPFGSFVSSLFTRWGDLDISVELSNGSHISSVGKKHKQTLLTDLLKAFRKEGGWSNLQFISHARVPILKLKSMPQNISCDISINNLLGQMKSKILLWISKIDSRFHDMVLLVKEWAKAHKINNSKLGTLNSYSLSLLVVFHFQTCAPSILPPLKDIYPGNMADDLIGVRADAENLIAETCDANINRFLSNKSRSMNKKSLSALFVDFLFKFAQIDSWSSQLGICPYTGEWEQIDSNMRWLPKTYALFVEDPFEQPQNTARSVSSGHLEKIAKAFLETYTILTTPDPNPSTLLTYLAPQEVSRSIVKPAIPNYSGGYYYPTQPQGQRAMHPHPRPPPHPHSYPHPHSHPYSARGSQNGRKGKRSNSPHSHPHPHSERETQNGRKAKSSNSPHSHPPPHSHQHSERGTQNGRKGTSSDSSTSGVRGTQNVRRGTSSNSSTSGGGPMQVKQGQQQQIWRQKIQ